VIQPFVRASIAAFALAVLPLVALADPSSTTLGITLNPSFGVHESFNDTVRVPPVPTPLLEFSHHFDRFEIAGFGLPPTVAIPYTDPIQSQTALRITILDLTLRVLDNSGRYGVGFGETIYNQTTHYAVADFPLLHPNTGEQQYSRVLGAHVELLARLPFRAGMLETSLRYVPTMLGTQVSTYESSAAFTRYDPERGQQIDGSIRYIHRIDAHRDAILGVRYVNYTARYDIPSRPLSDRNAGILPSFGYRWHIGR
jgi:hypothetical protein